MAETIQMVTMTNATLNATRDFPIASQSYWESRGWVAVSGPAAPVYDPTLDAYFGSLLTNPASSTGFAARAAFLRRWAANTTYAQDDLVIAPSGQVVKANAGFTSGASFDITKWTAIGGSSSPTVDTLPAGSTLTVLKSGSAWPARPTSRGDVVVAWKGPDPSPPIVSSGNGGMLDNVDYRLVTP